MTAESKAMNFHLVSNDMSRATLLSARNIASKNIITFDDHLTLGPVEEIYDFEEWLYKREKYLTSYFSSLQEDFVFQPTSFYNRLDEIKEAKELVLWCGVGLEDQLLLVLVVHVLDFLKVDLQTLKLAQFDHLRGSKFRALSIGMVDNQSISKKLIRHLSNDEVVNLRSAWRAFSSQNPKYFQDFIDDNPSCPSGLAEAFGYLLRRFPDHMTHLDYWETRILEACKSPARFTTVFQRVFSNSYDELDYYHESFMRQFLFDVSSIENTQALVRSSLEEISNDTVLELTALGQSILDIGLTEDLNILQDKWIGGFHITNKMSWYSEDNYSKIKRV